MGSLSLDIETLVELTPEDQKSVNGGALVSSPAPIAHPTPTAVSSAKPPAPVHHHKHKKHKLQPTSSVFHPTPI
jgi:hypothetical protein